jgi:NAD(P)-dependent dehydrogenase (short-subunit alcohol dehydrogenase family)
MEGSAGPAGPAGSAVVVVGGDGDGGVGERIAGGLSSRGQHVSIVAGSTVGPDAVEAACARAAATGPLAAVVHAHVPSAALERRPLVDVPDGEWDAMADEPVRALLRTLQAARRHLSAGGRIVVVVPTVALTGDAGLVALATAGEAQRVLAKSAARSWGGAGITVNAVAASPAALQPAAPPRAVAGGGNLDGAALPPAEDGDDDVVAAVALLLEPAAARLTGATLAADGGVVMAP